MLPLTITEVLYYDLCPGEMHDLCWQKITTCPKRSLCEDVERKIPDIIFYRPRARPRLEQIELNELACERTRRDSIRMLKGTKIVMIDPWRRFI